MSSNTIPLEVERFSKPVKTFIIIVIVLIGFVEGFATTGFLPALPAISKHFGVEIGFAQLAIPVYFLGYLTQIIYGVFSDHYGRKKIFIFGYAVFILGSAICVFTDSYFCFLVGRFSQGIGMCSVYLYRSVFSGVVFLRELRPGPWLRLSRPRQYRAGRPFPEPYKPH